jgi:hypothetical protein
MQTHLQGLASKGGKRPTRRLQRSADAAGQPSSRWATEVTTMQTPKRLFKYLPSRYADAFVRRGDLLFRNLAYFRQIEELGRGDLLEGLHIDRPDNAITLTREDGRSFSYDGASMINEIAVERLFVFCLSTALLGSLFDEFKSDVCVEIVDPTEFFRRCERTVDRQVRWQESGLLHGPVEYYAPNKPAVGNTKDPKCIPFFKHESYAHQREYRLAASLSGGLRVKTLISLPGYDLQAEASGLASAHRRVRIGSLEDISIVHRSLHVVA